jgi:hypothetical protein
MNSFRLALAFMLIPRLFRTLFLIPLAISLCFVYLQLLVTGTLLSASNTDPKHIQKKIKNAHENNIVKKILLGTNEPLNELSICRWNREEEEGLKFSSIHPQMQGCVLDRYDVVLHVEEPMDFDPSEYEQIFTGNFRRLHLCRGCLTDIVIDLTRKNDISAHTYSVWGLALLSSTDFSGETLDSYFKVLNQVDRAAKLTGERYLHAKGFINPLKVSDLADTLCIIANFALLLIIALWLSLRAHRKVLDYFSDSDALLPMVAATGKETFYGAIWFLTLMRVSVFFVCALPFCLLSLRSLVNRSFRELFFAGDFLAFAIWLITLTASISLATLLASIADLKHRRSILSFAYRYIPLLLCFCGGGLWALSFAFPLPFVTGLRDTLSVLPLIGMAPIILAPVFTPKYGVLVLHSLLTVAILVVLARRNARWFAAHLEDI